MSLRIHAQLLVCGALLVWAPIIVEIWFDLGRAKSTLTIIGVLCLVLGILGAMMREAYIDRND